jgi:tetratricopeptide (TPR) repeat protein
MCYYQLKNYTLSIQYANQVLITDPNNFKSHYRIALSFKELKDYERSLAEIKVAFQLN